MRTFFQLFFFILAILIFLDARGAPTELAHDATSGAIFFGGLSMFIAILLEITRIK